MITLRSGGMAKNKWHKMPLRLTEDQIRKADFLAAKWEMTRTEAIRECLELGFAKETWRRSNAVYKETDDYQ